MASLLSLGSRAMFANMAALQTTGNNISNANTKGYSRQETQLETAGGQYTGAGFFGRGVNVTTITRSYDQFLTTQAANAASISSFDATRADQLKQLEYIFTLGDKGLGHAAGQLLNAFVDMANNPSDDSARQVILTRAKELSAHFSNSADQLSALQGGVVQDMQAGVNAVNAYAKQVAALNHQISSQLGAGHTPNDLLDQRDLLVAEISKQINVTTVQANDGSLGLFVGGGQTLVLGSNAGTMKAAPDLFDPSKFQLAMQEGAVDRFIPQSSIAGGSLAGLMKFQNEDLVDARNMLGQMAVAITGALNRQQSLGLDVRQPPGSGAPIFSVGEPRVLPATSNTGDVALSVSVGESSQIQSSDYELQFDGTNYSMVRLSDGRAVDASPISPDDLAAGVQVEGMFIQITAGGAAVGDRFRLQPVTTAAETMRTVLGDPKGLAAASPVTATFGAGNTGTMSVGTLGAVSPSLDRTLTANVRFTSDTGDFEWELLDADGNATETGTGAWSAGTPIALNGFELMLDGVPRSGDTLSVLPTVSVGSNNGNALALTALNKAQFVGAQTAADGSLIPGRSITDAYSNVIANVGVRVQSAQTSANISSSFAAASETARANRAGVNLDEEAARLIQFQQSYQAAAKVLQVAQTLFDSMLQMAAR